MKNKMILLVSMLLPLVSSCEEKLTLEPTVEPTIESTLEPTVEPTIEPTVEPTVDPTVEPTTEIVYNYKESEYAEILNNRECSRNMFGSPLAYTDYINREIHKKNHSIIQFSGKKSEDYYLCAYIYHNDLEFMKSYVYDYENPPIFDLLGSISYPELNFNVLRGVEGTFLMMNHFKREKEVKNRYPDYTLKDIIWYEIPIDEEIPTNIGEYDLSLISQIYYFNYFDLDNNLLGEKPYLMECRNHITYKNLNAHTDKLINNNVAIINKIKQKEKYIIGVKYTPEIDFIDHLFEFPFSKIEIETIDGSEYIFIGDETVEAIGPDKYELIKISDYEYYIKVEDIVDYIKTNVY